MANKLIQAASTDKFCDTNTLFCNLPVARNSNVKPDWQAKGKFLAAVDGPVRYYWPKATSAPRLPTATDVLTLIAVRALSQNPATPKNTLKTSLSQILAWMGKRDRHGNRVAVKAALELWQNLAVELDGHHAPPPIARCTSAHGPTSLLIDLDPAAAAVLFEPDRSQGRYACRLYLGEMPPFQGHMAALFNLCLVAQAWRDRRKPNGKGTVPQTRSLTYDRHIWAAKLCVPAAPRRIETMFAKAKEQVPGVKVVPSAGGYTLSVEPQAHLPAPPCTDVHGNPVQMCTQGVA